MNQPHLNNDTARCCSEFNAFSRRELLSSAASKPLHRIQIPSELVDDGAERFFERGITRRQMLRRTGGLMLGMAVASQLTPLRLLENAAAANDPNAPILVTIYLGGGNDGINTLVPTSGAERTTYEALRTRIGVNATKLLPLPNRPDLGWHPSATGFKKLYDAGKMTVLPGTDYPNPSLSHFESEHNWRTGTLDPHGTYGWLGRYLDRVGTGNPLEGIAVQWGGDGALNGKRAMTSTVHDISDYAFEAPGVWNTARMMGYWSQLGDSRGKSSAYLRSMAVKQATFQTYTQLKPLAAQDTSTLPAPPVAYPADYELGQELRTLGRLLSAGLGTRVATLTDSQGYDTHDQQEATQSVNLANLSEALWAWQADLAARGLEDRVVTVVWSEFGRRAEDNEGHGTDHGTGGLLMVIGKHATGGVQTSGWELGSLDDDGNVPVQNDFRDVYAGLLEGHLKMDAASVLPGYQGTPKQLVA